MHLSRLLSPVLALLVAGGALVLPGVGAIAADPVVGSQTSGDPLFPHVGNGGYDVAHYDLDIEWEPQAITPQTIEATATITAMTTEAPLSQFSLDLEGLAVQSVTVDGEPAAHSRIEDNTLTKHKLVVTPAAAVEGTFTTVVTYGGTPVAHEDADGSMEGWNATPDGATFLNQPIGSMTGFPNNNTPADKATYSISLDIPSTINLSPAAAVSNGELVAKTVADARTTWHWEQEEQMASAFALISIGNYTVYDETIQLASGRQLRELSFIDPTAVGAAGATAARGKLKSYIDFFESRYGAYPGNSTGIVVDNIPLTAGINYALETQDRAFFPNLVGTSTNIHETMHQWWGDGVSPRVWNDLWLSEGAATFSEYLFPNESTPQTSTTTTEDRFYGMWNSTADDSTNWHTPPAAMSHPAQLFRWQSYQRGAMTLEALKAAIGTADFDTLMRRWQTENNGTSPGTAAFISLAEDVSDKDLTAFFQDWIYDPDKPAWPGKFNLALASSPSSGTAAPGSGVTYTVTAGNTGRVALTGAVVTVDLSDVLDDASVSGALPGDTSLDGTTLTWNVPSTSTSATSTLTLPVTVNRGVTDAVLIAVAAPSAATLGGTCTTCTSALTATLGTLATSSVPKLRGKAKVGKTLTAVAGHWEPDVVLTYRWYVGGKVVRRATGTKLKVKKSYAGKRIRVKVTGVKPGYASLTVASKRTAKVV